MKSDQRSTRRYVPGSTKKRNVFLSSILSFVSSGMGQIYNGELLNGILQRIALFLSIGLYMYLNMKTDKGLFYLTLLLALFLLLKLYSVVQAFVKSRKLGTSYVLKKFNKTSVYLVLMVVFLALNLFFPLTLPNWFLVENNSHHPFRSAKAKEKYLAFYDTIAEKWPVESETVKIDTSYGQTFVRISGPADAPPLALLHGAGTSSLMWIPNVEPLTEFFRVYAVDNIYDWGRSVYTQKLKSPEDVVRWLDELFDGLDLGNNITLIGMSYGGWVTSQFALRHQDRLDKIVLLAPAATVADLSWEFAKGGIRLWLWPYKSSYRKFLDWALGEPAQNSGQTAGLDHSEIEFEFLAMRSFKPKMPVSPTVLTNEDWHSLQIPIFLMIGDKEVIYSVSAQEAVTRIETIVPCIETALIPNAGHGFTKLQADIVNRKILEFLKNQKIPAKK